MAQTLLILRHAKSAWDTNAEMDFDRPLSDRGQRDAPRIGRWLYTQGLQPDRIVSSPAIRAKQTTKSVCDALRLEKATIVWDKRIYAASPGELLEVMSECPAEVKTLLVVGHNPGLESVLRRLCGTQIPSPPDGKLLPTATVARLELEAAWKEIQSGATKLISITRPRDLGS